MSRTSRSKELQDELRKLFDQGTSEQDAYDELKEDPRFSTLRLARISTIYKEFRSNQGKKPKSIKPAEHSQLPEKALLPIKGSELPEGEQLAYFQSMLKCDHKYYDCLKWVHSQSPDGRFFIRFNLVLGFKNTGKVYLTDIFSRKTSQFKFSLDQVENYDSCSFYPLTYDMGLLVECADYNDQRTFSKIFVSLLELDWINKESRKLHTAIIEVQQRRFKSLKILIDEMDPEKFALKLTHGDDDQVATFKFGGVANNEIFFTHHLFLGNAVAFFTHHSFVDNKLYTMSTYGLDRLNMILLSVTDLDHGTQNFWLNLDEFLSVEGKSTICFTPDRVLVATRFEETQHYGIIWSKLEAEQWIELDFRTKERIQGIRLVADGQILLIQTVGNDTQLTRGVHRFRTTLYRIPLKKPEKLSALAWFSLVRSKIRIPNVNPYDEARNYLPFNSEIQFPFEE